MSAPKFPRRHTMAARTLALLIESGGAGINHRTLDVLTRSYRLAGYVHTLRGMGWPVMSELFTTRVELDGGRPVNIARYWLSDAIWEAIKPAEALAFVAEVRAWERGRLGDGQGAPGASAKQRDGKPRKGASCPSGQYSKRRAVQ